MFHDRNADQQKKDDILKRLNEKVNVGTICLGNYIKWIVVPHLFGCVINRDHPKASGGSQKSQK